MVRTSPSRLFASVLLSSLMAACAPDDAPIVTTSQAIAGGETAPGDTAVVGFYYLAGGSLCSGSLIAPNVVLTARHCVAPTLDTAKNGGVICSKTKFGEPGDPVSFLVTTATTITIGNAGEYLAQEVALLPVETDAFCGNDMAILILKDEVPPEVATPFTPRVDAPLAAGETYSAIGYGSTDDNGTGAGTRRRRDGLVVDCVGEGCSVGVEATEWVGDTGVCHGDSGGPAIDAEGRVVGVVSRGSLGCDNPIYGDVYSWRQWLKDTVAHASGLGEYPAPAWTEGAAVKPEWSMPVGGACASDADCFSGHCVKDGGAAYCTRICEEKAPCPEGYVCADGEPALCREPAAEPKPAPKSDEEPAEDGGCAIRGGAGRSTVEWSSVAAALVFMGARLRRRGGRAERTRRRG